MTPRDASWGRTGPRSHTRWWGASGWTTSSNASNPSSRNSLLDSQVRFLEGWFSETLPTAPIRALAVLRLDGDLYKSTMDVLTHLYPKVTPGGYAHAGDVDRSPSEG